tara:strand:+ start:1155 stop:2306 length:1152 start_codon:yes stop_codon:yes gene_type:complete
MMQFTDRMVTDGKFRKTDDGHVVQARVARGGNVQDYRGAELGLTDREIVRVYRPEVEVFARDAIATYARKPITIGHPAQGVTDATWKGLAVGEIDRDVMRDGEFVSVPLLFRDATAIALMQDAAGPKELSMGYEAKIEMQDGVTPDGQPFDAVMSDFKMNHVAVVPRARGGAELRIGDSADARWGASPIIHDGKDTIMADANQTRTVLIDGLSVVTTDAGAQALEKLQGQIADGKSALTDAETKHAKEIADKDAELAKANAAKDAAEAKVLSDAQIDQRVADRAELLATAKAIASDVETKGLSDADVRKAVVIAKLGDGMSDKSAAYIDARFDILAEDAAKGDPVADALKGKKQEKVTSLDKAYKTRNTDLSNAWMGAQKKEA